ncbi:MAG: hypothetical protein IKB34_00715 [Clostridia bacterium]|nr:hypothetical protein [Clostridia bacterium]
MSEEEKRIRLNYRVVRKKKIALQAYILLCALVITVISALLAVLFDKTYYIDCEETSSADYGVHLKENDYYDETYLGKNYAYIASLIDQVEAKFSYEMLTYAPELIDFEYTYRIDAIVEVKNGSNGKVLFDPVYNVVPEQTHDGSGSGVRVTQTVLIDYDKYNEIATKFIKKYKLESGVKVALVIKMSVCVKGTSDQFDKNQTLNSHVASISVPLNANTLEVSITSQVPDAQHQILSYTTENVAEVFRIISVVFAIITLTLGATVLCFIYISRNIDVTYEIQVSRLLRNYKSFIQRISSSDAFAEYKRLEVKTFEEMLEIRDIIEAPILMHENSDNTCTAFMIPADSNILYIFEIKVEDYDEIYGERANNEV